MKLAFALLVIGCTMTRLMASDVGHFSVTSAEVGTAVDLTGKWHFTPGSAPDAKPVPVPVPQMLSRIQ